MALSGVRTSLKVISASREMQMAPVTHLWQSPAVSLQHLGFPGLPVLGWALTGAVAVQAPREGQTVPTGDTQGRGQGCVPTVAQEELAVLNPQWIIRAK